MYTIAFVVIGTVSALGLLLHHVVFSLAYILVFIFDK